MVIGAIAVTAAVVCLAAAAVYQIATARQDREEWTRPKRRLSVESAAETRWQDSKVGFALAVIAILVVPCWLRWACDVAVPRSDCRKPTNEGLE
jgi:hypothetical protein